jgi:HAD superfamily hydrolase (TIGR01509 family)
MKKLLFALIMASASLTAAPQAVVFDWGNVLATDDRSVVVEFMCTTFHLSASEFEAVNLEKRKAMQAGMSDVQFWTDYATRKGIGLPSDWPQSYTGVLIKSIGVNAEMFALVNELKAQNIRVGILSNINDKYIKLIRDFGFYEPFDPCLLSAEIGVEKPNPEAYEILLDAIDLPAEEIVFVDDKAENIEAAKLKKIDAILFESPDQVREEFSKRGLLAKDLSISFHPKVN